MSYAQAEREQQDQYSPEVENEASPEQGRISAFEKYGMSNSARRGRLRVGAADDGTEREADRVASAVMGGPSRLHEQDAAIKAAASESSVSQGAGVLQRSTEDGASGESFEAGSELTEDMGRSAGYQLDSSAASRIGGRLGADFSGVRIHTDRHAERVAMGMSARAFTKGRDIYFNRGQYNPGTAAGQELLAHELTHTIQQGEVSQEGGIPVTQRASAQTAQRGFFSLRKHFRKAVDERNENYEDYKKQGKWTRFKWVMKNPIAWMFGRLPANKKNTETRAKRRALIDSLDPQTAMAPGENFEPAEKQLDAATQGEKPENEQEVREAARLEEEAAAAPSGEPDQEEEKQEEQEDTAQEAPGDPQTEEAEPAPESAAAAMGRQTEEEEAAESPQEEQPEEEDIYDDGEGGSEVIKILKQVKAPQGEATQPEEIAAEIFTYLRNRGAYFTSKAQKESEPGVEKSSPGFSNLLETWQNRLAPTPPPPLENHLHMTSPLIAQLAALYEGSGMSEANLQTAGSSGGDPNPPEGLESSQAAAIPLAQRRAEELQAQNELLGAKNAGEQQQVHQGRMGKVSLGGSIGGGVVGGIGSALTLLGRWNETEAIHGANGMGQTLDIDAFSNFAEKSGDVLKDVGGAFSIGGSVAGIVGNIMDGANALLDAEDWRASGDKKAAAASYLDAARAVVSGGKSGVSMCIGINSILGAANPVLTQVGGGFGAVAGGLKMASAGIELKRTRDVMKNTKRLNEGYEDKMADIAYRLKVVDALEAMEALPASVRQSLKGDKEKQNRRERRLRAQAGFMRMGHNTAEVDRLKARYKMVSGALETVGGVTSLAGGGGVGTGIALAGTGVDLAGKIHSGLKESKLKRGEVDRTLDMDARIDEFVKKSDEVDKRRAAVRRDTVNITRREAKHVMLRESGFVSRSEAYLSMAKDRMEVLKELKSAKPAKRDEMVRALGLDPEKATDAAIYQRLGLDKKQAANIDRAMLKQKKKRLLPSWRT